ncbi:hypothetical protein A33M_3427 [Rhodovulum sp. PH10]|nr:hypothetical protein A33M_3427 [Rhodovulum sp. PH10]
MGEAVQLVFGHSRHPVRPAAGKSRRPGAGFFSPSATWRRSGAASPP